MMNKPSEAGKDLLWLLCNEEGSGVGNSDGNESGNSETRRSSGEPELLWESEQSCD